MFLVLLADARHQFQAVQAGQDHIREHQVRPLGFEQGPGLPSVRSLMQGRDPFFQDPGRVPSLVLVRVDDQEGKGPSGRRQLRRGLSLPGNIPAAPVKARQAGGCFSGQAKSIIPGSCATIPFSWTWRASTAWWSARARSGRARRPPCWNALPNALTVVDPNPPSKDMAALVGRHGLAYEQRAFREEDLKDKWLVVAATGNQDLNWRIANLCKDRNVPCNVVDHPEAGSFIVPATLAQGDLTLAVSTSGASPALARKIRRDLEELFGSQYAAFLVVMARLRPLLIELGLPNGSNAELFRAVGRFGTHGYPATRRPLRGPPRPWPGCCPRNCTRRFRRCSMDLP